MEKKTKNLTQKEDELEEENKKLKEKIANFRRECIKDYFTISPDLLEFINRVEKYFQNE